MSPTPRAALAVAVIAVSAVLLPLELVAVLALGLVAGVGYDLLAVRRPPEVDRRLPAILSRGVPAELRLEPVGAGPGPRRLRQPALPDVGIEPSEADERLDAVVVGRRRGRHRLPAVALRTDGPLGLGRWFHPSGGSAR